MTEFEKKILDKLDNILEAIKEGTNTQKEMIELFQQYDVQELMNDEEMRNAQLG